MKTNFSISLFSLTLFWLAPQFSALSQADFLTAKVGDQIWMAKNLDVVVFANGDSIFHAQTRYEWIKAAEDSIPAYCYYNNDPKNVEKYGLLYNWLAITDGRDLAPEGWRVPTIRDYRTLVDYLGGASAAGNALRKPADWNITNSSDSYGFGAMPGGYRTKDGFFDAIGEIACFWTLNYWDDKGQFASIGGSSGMVLFGDEFASAGMSCRLLISKY